MSTNVANLAAKLSLDATSWQRGWKEATKAAEDFDKKVKSRASGQSNVASLGVLGGDDVMADKFARFKAGNEMMRAEAAKTAASTRNLSAVTNQLGFAIEDAAVSYGTGGFAGAIRGAGNNVAAMAMMMGGGTVAMVTTLTLAAVNLGLSFAKAGDGAKKAAAEMERLKRVAQELKDARLENILGGAGRQAQVETLQKKVGEANTADDAENNRDAVENAITGSIERRRELELEVAAIQQRQVDIAKEIEASWKAVEAAAVHSTSEQARAQLEVHTAEKLALETEAAELVGKATEKERERTAEMERQAGLAKLLNDAKQKAAELAHREAQAADRLLEQKQKEEAIVERNKQIAEVDENMKKEAEQQQKAAEAAKAKEQREKGRGDREVRSEPLRGVGAFQEGSREAFSLIQSQLRGNFDNTPKKQLAEAEKANAKLDAIVAKPVANIEFAVADF